MNGQMSGEQDQEIVWCERCMDHVAVVDEFEDVIQEYAGQRGVHVTQFACGHEVHRNDGTFYPFP